MHGSYCINYISEMKDFSLLEQTGSGLLCCLPDFLFMKDGSCTTVLCLSQALIVVDKRDYILSSYSHHPWL